MKIKIFFFLILFLISGCSIKNNNKITDNKYEFSDDLTFEQIKSILEEYSKISSYPNLNE